MLLSPQLFQQQERYQDYVLQQRCAVAGPYFWGFRDLHLDGDALDIGKLVLSRARGIFPDGTVFEIGHGASSPPALDLRPEHAQQTVFLALARRRDGGTETDFGDASQAQQSQARYGVFDAEIPDANSIGLGSRTVQLARLRLRLLPESALGEDWMGLPVARVQAVQADGRAQLDPSMIPAVNACSAETRLRVWLEQIQAQVGRRADELAQRIGAGPGVHAAEIAEYLLLQLLNACEPALEHVLGDGRAGPDAAHLLLRSLDAQLSTYLRGDTRRARTFPPYCHSDLNRCFQPLVDDLRSLLNSVLARAAEPVELRALSHGMYLASMDPAELKRLAALVLAVKADVAPGKLAHQFSAAAKIAPSDRLPEHVRLHLPGIRFSLLPAPPRQIPLGAGFLYFQLQAEGPLWEHMLSHGGIGLHLAGELPGLELQLWRVR